MSTRKAAFDRLLGELLAACQRHYGQRLVSLAVFGSVGRGTAGPESDIDLLIVADSLPAGRLARADDFAAVESELGQGVEEAKASGVNTRFSPILKTPSEAEQGSPLFLDMLEDAKVLYDRNGYLAGVFDRLRERLARLGARRIWRGNAWYWDLKPDYRPGEVFEI